MAIALFDLIEEAAEKGSSDVHVGMHQRPKIRLHSKLIDTDHEVTTPEIMERYLREITPPERLKKFYEIKEMDFSFVRKTAGSCRVNLSFERNSPNMAIRILPSTIWSFEQCGYSIPLLKKLADAPTGLILVTGATGSGKTTTLASMVDYINSTRPCHIITVEDPIEFMHTNKKAKIDQREVGQDTQSFTGALKYILRQDPDVVLIGEMRDLETIETALNVAETGHLVMATLHTSDATQTVNRVVDVFPEHKQHQVRVQLSFVLNAVLSQRLVPSSDGKRILSSEVMIATAAVRAMIRDEKIHQIYSSIQTGSKEGMHTMNHSLMNHVMNGKIKLEEAILYSSNVEELLNLIEGQNKNKKK